MDERRAGGVFDVDDGGEAGDAGDEAEPEIARAGGVLNDEGQEADFVFSAADDDDAAIKRPDDRLVIHDGDTFDVEEPGGGGGDDDLLTTSTRTFCLTFCFSAIFRRFSMSP